MTLKKKLEDNFKGIFWYLLKKEGIRKKERKAEKKERKMFNYKSLCLVQHSK